MLRRYTNLAIVMLLGGLWHGAGWTFILWGGLHGFFLVLNHSWRALVRQHGLEEAIKHPSYQTLSWLLTFIAVVFAWVLFRAGNLSAAGEVYNAMLGINGIGLPDRVLNLLGPIGNVLTAVGVEGRPRADFVLWRPISSVWIVALLTIVLMCPNTAEWMNRYVRRLNVDLGRPPFGARWRPTMIHAVTTVILLFYAMFYINETPSEFLYFQF